MLCPCNLPETQHGSLMGAFSPCHPSGSTRGDCPGWHWGGTAGCAVPGCPGSAPPCAPPGDVLGAWLCSGCLCVLIPRLCQGYVAAAIRWWPPGKPNILPCNRRPGAHAAARLERGAGRTGRGQKTGVPREGGRNHIQITAIPNRGPSYSRTEKDHSQMGKIKTLLARNLSRQHAKGRGLRPGLN